MHYKKLFDKSEIEYITPFLKLWMAFNNWYKQDGNFRRDADAINHYKTEGRIKEEFLKLFLENSDEGIEFRIAIYELVLNIRNYNLKYPNGDSVKYSDDLIYENRNKISGSNPIWISEDKKRFQIPDNRKEDLFSETLGIIYQVRSSLVHGDFDIENQYFLKLVEASYKILYPIMDRILERQAGGGFIIQDTRKNVDAIALFDNGEMTVLVGSKVAKEVDDSYGDDNKIRERQTILQTKAIEHEHYFELKENIEFPCPSSASSFCLGYNSNGWEEWKTLSGKSMNDILRNFN